MRISFLCKRRYMGKDVIDDRYARLYEIPYQLARLGHEVHGWCLGYQGQAATECQHEASPGHLSWSAHSLAGTKLFDLLRYPNRLQSELRRFAPQLLIGASDIPHVALTHWLSKRLGVPYVVDLYDNFEGFGQARIPGMTAVLHRSVREAKLVMTTSELLASLVRDKYQAKGEVIALPSTIDKARFRPLDSIECRHALGLPMNARLIGTAGGLHADKGVGTVYAAWQQIASELPDAHLVLAGPLDRTLKPPQGERVHYLGELPHARMPELFSALDVGMIYLRETAFGRYCFPQKAYEMLACGLPVIAARVGAMVNLFADAPENLYRPDDADDLARCIRHQLGRPNRSQHEIEDWATVVGKLEPRLRALME